MSERIPAYWKEGFYLVFNSEKAIAALSYFLELKGGTADFYYLNKMMYLLERKSILERGMPVFYDRLCSLPFGPVPSNVNDELKNVRQLGDFADWSSHFKFIKQNTVSLAGAFNKDVLSRYELKSIEIIHTNIENDLQLSRHPVRAFHILHEYITKLPEYVEIKSGSSFLTYDSLLEKNGVSRTEVDSIFSEIEYQSQLALSVSL